MKTSARGASVSPPASTINAHGKTGNNFKPLLTLVKMDCDLASFVVVGIDTESGLTGPPLKSCHLHTWSITCCSRGAKCQTHIGHIHGKPCLIGNHVGHNLVVDQGQTKDVGEADNCFGAFRAATTWLGDIGVQSADLDFLAPRRSRQKCAGDAVDADGSRSHGRGRVTVE